VAVLIANIQALLIQGAPVLPTRRIVTLPCIWPLGRVTASEADLFQVAGN
jgi:hypothetical protein